MISCFMDGPGFVLETSDKNRKLFSQVFTEIGEHKAEGE